MKKTKIRLLARVYGLMVLGLAVYAFSPDSLSNLQSFESIAESIQASPYDSPPYALLTQ